LLLDELLAGCNAEDAGVVSVLLVGCVAEDAGAAADDSN